MAQYIEAEYDKGRPKKKSVAPNKGGGKRSAGKNAGKRKLNKKQRRRKSLRRKQFRRMMILGGTTVFLAMAVVVLIGVSVYRDTYDQMYLPLEGKGTIEEPYLIKSVDDLEYLSLQVNHGTEFEGIFFRQENDLDFSNYRNWRPIGAYDSGYYFKGVYDGHGHSIQNITIDGKKLQGVDDARMNVGLFGILAGTVCNLRIESGTITGNRIGSIASYGTDKAVIVNCYNQASLTATDRCGGIADNLCDGKIIACANEGTLTCDSEEGIGGISSYSAGVIYACYSMQYPVSEDFAGQIYQTNQVQDVYLGIADGDLEQVQKVFADDLMGVELIKYGKEEKTK